MKPGRLVSYTPPIVIEIFRVLNLVMTPAWKAEMPAIIAATELVIDICEEMN